MSALLIDIGNSRVKWRIALDATDAETGGSDAPRWIRAERALPLGDIGRIESAFGATFTDAAASEQVGRVLIANVASEAVGAAVETAVAAVWPEARVQRVRSAAAQCGVVNAYRDPLQLGVDRWLAAIAARALCRERPVLVCTFGTATTIDLVETTAASRPSAVFVGGLILPGIDAMQNALTTTTARLPALAGRVVDFADRTEDAIASGVMAAQIGAVQRALQKTLARPGAAPPPICIVAGGAATRMLEAFDGLDTPYRVVHDLVLRGLAHVACETVATPGPCAVPSAS